MRSCGIRVDRGRAGVVSVVRSQSLNLSAHGNVGCTAGRLHAVGQERTGVARWPRSLKAAIETGVCSVAG